MGQLDGKTALVTGASRGLGAGIALAFAREGADVAVNHFPDPAEREKALAVAGQIRSLGRRAIVVEADVTIEEQVASMVDSVIAEFGEIRILMNNAGNFTMCKVADMTLDEWEATITCHLRGSFLTSKHCLKQTMLGLGPFDGQRRAAKIINTSSGIGQVGGEFGASMVHYVTAKAGILGFTKALAGELAPLITVNAIAPGMHQTDMGNDPSLAGEWLRKKMERYPLGWGTVDDVAATAVFLASPQADYFTGQVLMPNGGYVMNG
jgi:3-oxoacyl-[acyl-carrier protein] reductase